MARTASVGISLASVDGKDGVGDASGYCSSLASSSSATMAQIPRTSQSRFHVSGQAHYYKQNFCWYHPSGTPRTDELACITRRRIDRTSKTLLELSVIKRSRSATCNGKCSRCNTSSISPRAPPPLHLHQLRDGEVTARMTICDDAITFMELTKCGKPMSRSTRVTTRSTR